MKTTTLCFVLLNFMCIIVSARKVHHGKSSGKSSSQASDEHSGPAKDVGSKDSPPSPPPREPKPRPQDDDLDFSLHCPPEHSFRLVPYSLIDQQQQSSKGKSTSSITVKVDNPSVKISQSGNSPAKASHGGNPPAKASKGGSNPIRGPKQQQQQPPLQEPPGERVYGWGPQPGRFPSSKESELHSTWNNCIHWKPGKQPNNSNQIEKLLEAFWAWLGIDDCSSTTSTDTDASSSISGADSSSSSGTGTVLSDLPMMDTPGLVTSCSLKTQITDKITAFTKPGELEAYWRTLFKNDKSNESVGTK